MPDASPSRAAERQRRYRERRRRRAVVVPVELREEHFDVLSRLGLLPGEEVSPRSVGQAIARLIEHWAQKKPLCVTRAPPNSG